MSATAYINARLLDPSSKLDETGSLLIEDGKITAIGADVVAPANAKQIDCGGNLLAPGLVDMRSFAIDAASAAAGGITTIALMPDGTRTLDSDVTVDHAIRQAREAASVNVVAVGAATKELAGVEMAELGLMHIAGAVAFSDGRNAIADPTVMRRLLDYSSVFDAPIIQHPEDPTLAADGVMTEGETATRLGLPAIPTMAEAIMIERDCRILRHSAGRLHIGLVSTSESLDVLRQARRSGLPVTAATAPHYFALNETAVGDYRTFTKVSPPLREEDDRAAIAAGLADGTIDVICSAHEPHDEEEKRLPFADAEAGIVGYETLLPLSLELYHKGEVDLLTLFAAMTSRPAEILGLDCGRLAAGAPADLVLIDLDAPDQIDVETFKSVTKNSPFDARPVQGRVLKTIVAGEEVFTG